MGRKSSQKAARRAEKEQQLVESTIRRNEHQHELYRDAAVLCLLDQVDRQFNAQIKQQQMEATVDQHEALYGGSDITDGDIDDGVTSVPSNSAAAVKQFRDNKFNLSKRLNSVREQADFEDFCDCVRRAEDVSEALFDDPDFRKLYKHIVDMGRISKACGMDFGQSIDLIVSNNISGTDPNQLIARYSKNKKVDQQTKVAASSVARK